MVIEQKILDNKTNIYIYTHINTNLQIRLDFD